MFMNMSKATTTLPSLSSLQVQQSQQQNQQQQQHHQQQSTRRLRRALLSGCTVLAAMATCTSTSCLFMILPTAAAAASATAATAFVTTRLGPLLRPCRSPPQQHSSFAKISHSRLFTTRTSTTDSSSSSSATTSAAATTTASSTKASMASASASSVSSSFAPSSSQRQQQQHSLLTQTTDTVALHHSDFFESSTSSYTSPTQQQQQQQQLLQSASPVVFLHGLLGNRRNFATIARSLAAQLSTKRRLLAVDLRNHGDTAVNQTRPSMTYTEMAADVLQFLNTHQLDKAVLVGHSMGGKVAQAVALLAPERVEGLVVLDMAPVAYDTHHDTHWKAVVDILHVLNNVPSDATSKKQVEMYLQPHIPDPALRAFCLTNWNAATGTWKIPMADIVQSIEHLADFAIPTDKQYAGDVFLIHGGQSRFVRHSYMPTIAQYFPNHLLTTIKGAGHWVHAEAPEDTTALLKRYLDR